MEQLKEFPERDLLVVMECAGNGHASMNPAIKGMPWNLGAISQVNLTGTSLRNIHEFVGYTKDAIKVRITGMNQGKSDLEERKNSSEVYLWRWRYMRIR